MPGIAMPGSLTMGRRSWSGAGTLGGAGTMTAAQLKRVTDAFTASLGGGGTAPGGIAIGAPSRSRRPGGPYADDVETDPQGRQFYRDFTGRRIYLPSSLHTDRRLPSPAPSTEPRVPSALPPPEPRVPSTLMPAEPRVPPTRPAPPGPSGWYGPGQETRPTFQPPFHGSIPEEAPPVTTTTLPRVGGTTTEDIQRLIDTLTRQDMPTPSTTSPTTGGNVPRERAPEDPRIQRLIDLLMAGESDPDLEALRGRLTGPSRVRPIDISGAVSSETDPEARAYRVSRLREGERQRRALAERMAASGGVTGSGAFDVGVGQVGEQSARDIAGYEAGLVGKRRAERLAAEQARFNAELAAETQERAGYSGAIGGIMDRLANTRASRLAALQALLQRQAAYV